MKLLYAAQSDTCGHVIAKVVRRGKTIEMTIADTYFNDSEVYYLLQCDNVSDVNFTEYESLSFTVTDGISSTDYNFERLYL